ncbi:hypothetical protein EVAR_6895_1 [Eumeta japonica]|uniref:Uncharacterized protein n=1 Tax=Eumeta variegata TaxID=151549 RepID=A0A4C1THE4_EUMVA|nr:hypothetical protein EVAR_6895_1 [Eumeta japonica]
MQEVFAWRQLTYTVNESTGNTDNYIQYNNIPIGVERHQHRLFITVPRRRHGAGLISNLMWGRVELISNLMWGRVSAHFKSHAGHGQSSFQISCGAGAELISNLMWGMGRAHFKSHVGQGQSLFQISCGAGAELISNLMRGMGRAHFKSHVGQGQGSFQISCGARGGLKKSPKSPHIIKGCPLVNENLC